VGTVVLCGTANDVRFPSQKIENDSGGHPMYWVVVHHLSPAVGQRLLSRLAQCAGPAACPSCGSPSSITRDLLRTLTRRVSLVLAARLALCQGSCY